MQTSRIMNVVDRAALTLMNAVVFIVLPVAAVSLFIR